MATVLIVHGLGGSPEENWFPHLKENLERAGCTVLVPQFPTPKGQDIKNWISEIEKHTDVLDNDSILVGHSVGATFLLSVLERLERPVRAAFLVAGFTGPLGLPDFDLLNESFAEKEFDWERIRANCSRIYVVSSNDDPYVPLERGRELAAHLHAKLIVLKKAGHINRSSGFKEFPLLLEMVRSEMDWRTGPELLL